MRLLDITATAHPSGNRIDLSWTNPSPGTFPGVRVVRRIGTHPTSPDDGAIVAQGTGLTSASDTGLKGETVYYYALFPFNGNPPLFEGDPNNRVSALATAPYDFAGQMYALLPAVYHRYDEANGPNGPLRRFLDLPGGQFDQIYSLTRAALAFSNLGRVEGALLPLLAQWIGWRTDHGLEVNAQRNEIRFAPELYQTTGLIPTVEATVKRISGWESRTKEFVYNVARTNQAERLNLWSMTRSGGGAFSTPALASVNFVYEGRPASVTEADGSISLFYHTYRRHGWDIWTKRFVTGQWQPSAPVVDQPGNDKRPSVAMQGSRLWLFWESCDGPGTADHKWRINFRTRDSGVWSASQVFGDTVTARRMPTAVADNSGGVWLFWLEKAATGPTWTLKYSRHDGTNWLQTPISVPLDNGQDPRVESDLFVLFHPTSATQRIWLFWARRDPGPPGQKRWTIAYRIKAGLNPAAADWSVVRTLPKAAPANHDREPSPILAAGNNIELFWSSTRNGGWTLWRSQLDATAFTFSAPQQLTSTPYSNRAPLAVDAGGGNTLLTFRSNESLPYTSGVYGATETLDLRSNGATTADTRNTAKLALRGRFDDFQTYTYDAGRNGTRGNDDRIARDTIGLYLTPTIGDAAQIKAVVSRLSNVLDEFMPITGRAVFITP